MTRFLNLTPHVVRVYLGRADDPLLEQDLPSRWLVLPVTGRIAHVDQVDDYRHDIERVRVLHHSIGAVTGLPDPEPGVVYVVSSVGGRTAMRADCLSPDTKSAAIYDASGEMYGVRRMQRWTARGAQ